MSTPATTGLKVGTLVRFANEKHGGPVHRIIAVGRDGMVDLHDMGGWFAPHLFEVADDIGGIPPTVTKGLAPTELVTSASTKHCGCLCRSTHMPETTLPALPPMAREALPRELVKDIALEIGKEVASHIETMYPKAVEATSKNMLLSLRNSVFNDIMAAIDALESGDAEAWLARRQAQRRAIRAQWRKCRAYQNAMDGEAIYE